MVWKEPSVSHQDEESSAQARASERVASVNPRAMKSSGPIENNIFLHDPDFDSELEEDLDQNLDQTTSNNPVDLHADNPPVIFRNYAAEGVDFGTTFDWDVFDEHDSNLLLIDKSVVATNIVRSKDLDDEVRRANFRSTQSSSRSVPTSFSNPKQARQPTFSSAPERSENASMGSIVNGTSNSSEYGFQHVGHTQSNPSPLRKLKTSDKSNRDEISPLRVDKKSKGRIEEKSGTMQSVLSDSDLEDSVSSSLSRLRRMNTRTYSRNSLSDSEQFEKDSIATSTQLDKLNSSYNRNANQSDSDYEKDSISPHPVDFVPSKRRQTESSHSDSELFDRESHSPTDFRTLHRTLSSRPTPAHSGSSDAQSRSYSNPYYSDSDLDAKKISERKHLLRRRRSGYNHASGIDSVSMNGTSAGEQQ
jgi:hypothetical protein